MLAVRRGGLVPERLPSLSMKALLFAVVLTCSFARIAAADIDLPHVKVAGTAVIEIKPDMLRWRLTVRNLGPDVAALAEEHARIVATTLRFLQEAGIASADVQSTWMSLSENRVHHKGSLVKEGYVASTGIGFTAKDVARHRELWLGLARLEGVGIDAVVWDSSQRIATQNEARLQALQAAKTKAQAMAAALSSSIAEPLLIEEDMDIADYRGARAQMNAFAVAADGAAGEGDSVAAGTIPIRIRVVVAFRLVPAAR